MKIRAGGLILGLISGVLVKLCVVDVLTQARQGSDQLSLSLKGVVLGLVFSQMSVLMVLMGPAFQRVTRRADGEGLTAAGWLIVVAMFVPALAGYFWLRHHLEGMGYQFG